MNLTIKIFRNLIENRKEKELYQKIKTTAMVVQNLEVRKARAERRKQVQTLNYALKGSVPLCTCSVLHTDLRQ